MLSSKRLCSREMSIAGRRAAQTAQQQLIISLAAAIILRRLTLSILWGFALTVMSRGLISPPDNLPNGACSGWGLMNTSPLVGYRAPLLNIKIIMKLRNAL